MRESILTVPGYTNAGPLHWLTLWEQRYAGVARIQQRDWEHPRRDEWIAALERHISGASAPVLLAAHSLGAIAVAHWARASKNSSVVAGALLVAPADVDAAGVPPDLRSFAPVPLEPLPFPTIVVSSRNDPWVSWERATELAAAWRSMLVDAGAVGHLDSNSGLGEWRTGWKLLLGLQPV